MRALPPHLRAGHLNLMRLCVEGYWYCRACQFVTEPEVDGPKPFNTCGLCGSSAIEWRGAVFVNAPNRVCPLCHPEEWDGGLEEVPEAKFCERHAGHPLVETFRKAKNREVDWERLAQDLVATLGVFAAARRRARRGAGDKKAGR